MTSELAPGIISRTPGSIAESRCLVIGAASGIGLATAERLRASGAVVIGADLPSARWSGGRAESSHAAGWSLAMDVTDPRSVRAAVSSALRTLGGLDVVVNCAGILGRVASALTTPVEEFDRILKINLTGAFIVSQAVLPAMAEAGYGRLLHISSTAGKEGVINMPAYSASKAGILGLVKSLAKEFALSGVTVNALAPGNVMTPLFQEVPAEQQAAQAAKIPMGRFGTPAEAAALIEFIVSPAASYTTGSVFDLSGGRATY
ncbi:SDR family oxidoreductase [Arthrobacter sp. NicSoilB8]|uniref:SDR family NAD(P)-dependent oxidoreductase n=1 Tax=Arthrobacter sp. NicSoilB8 TaxID=2830998 RepID=UPI001CC5D2A2|nr:SDR family oxidoreductase [Arthrobacter sp. NicSoilB8]BCW71601.1 dehydrogenase [Arthrobacter sp. NicSoilB8]